MSEPSIDFTQGMLNGSYCFHIDERNRYCGRAAEYPGHGLKHFHNFVESPTAALAAQLAAANERLRTLTDAGNAMQSLIHDLREKLKTVPEVQGREFIDLGVRSYATEAAWLAGSAPEGQS